MTRSIVAEGKTTNEAIEKGLKELKVSKNKVDIKVLDEKKKSSFFDILAPNVVKVEITVKEDVSDEELEKENKKFDENKEVKTSRRPEKVEHKEEKQYSSEELETAKVKVEKFLNEFIKTLKEDLSVTVVAENNEVDVEISGEKANTLIGYRGETLNSLQTILRSIANKDEETNVRVVLNIGDFKENRKKTLEDLAFKLEKTVYRTGKSVTLEPMTAYDRKTIHLYLQNSDKVVTYSIGEGERRRVVVEKK